MLRHQELLAQKKNELRLLEESISTNKQIIEQQQLQLQQINHHYKSNKKAKKDKSAVRTMDPEPTTTSPEPQLSDSAETSPDDYVKQQQSESTNRLKPLTQRRLNRIAHMKKKASFSPRPTISDTATTRRVTPEQHCLETINTMSSMSSSTFSSIPKKTHISKASVMEFYLKEKLRESSIREFEMMLNNT